MACSTRTTIPMSTTSAPRFAFETIVSPLPDSDDFRVSLNASEVQGIQADIESRTRNILHDATDECWKRLYKSVEHMTERLSGADNRFHDTLVGQPPRSR